jgi:hypothetical protein
VDSFDGLAGVFAEPVFVERRADADRDAAARAAVFRLRAVVPAATRLAETGRLGALVFERRAAMVRFATDFFDPAFLVERLTAVFLDTRLATLPPDPDCRAVLRDARPINSVWWHQPDVEWLPRAP